MDIVNHNHPMLVIDHFEVFASHNPGMVVFHATGHLMDTEADAYVVFPKKEAYAHLWTEELKQITSDAPHITQQLLGKMVKATA